MFGYDFPLLSAFWAILFVFLWVIWIFILFRVILDIFRSHDRGGWGKALWLVFVIVLPQEKAKVLAQEGQVRSSPASS